MPTKAEHGGSCNCKPCREFSTDGSRLGQEIAHLFGTKDENEIIQMCRDANREAVNSALTGMDEEQRDWEEGLNEV